MHVFLIAHIGVYGYFGTLDKIWVWCQICGKCMSSALHESWQPCHKIYVYLRDWVRNASGAIGNHLGCLCLKKLPKCISWKINLVIILHGPFSQNIMNIILFVFNNMYDSKCFLHDVVHVFVRIRYKSAVRRLGTQYGDLRYRLWDRRWVCVWPNPNFIIWF